MRLPEECEVLVVGGGFSGVAAALTAARCGMKTVLIERSARLGGAATLAMHQSICGLYGHDAKDGKDTLNDGIQREIVDSLLREPDTKGFERIGQVAVFSYEGETLRSLLRMMMNSQARLDWALETELVAVQQDRQGIRTVTLRNREGAAMTVRLRSVIDCTGSGQVIQLSGAAHEAVPVEKRQLAGYGFRLSGVQTSEKGLGLKVAYVLAKAAQAGQIEPHLRWSTWGPSTTAGEGVLKLSVLPTDPPKKIEGLKKDAKVTHTCLAETLTEFKNSKISKMGEAVAEREGLRMAGDYTLTAEDVLRARKFKDGVVKNAWPLEFWDPQKGPRYQYLSKGDYYEIPLRCLHSKSISNLFAAGRCISVTSEALASTRLSGTCLALGEASAKAAIASLQGDPLPCS